MKIKSILSMAIALILIVLFVLFIFYRNDYSPDAIKAESELKIEFKKINNLPEAIYESPISLRKASQALVGSKYTTSSKYNEIRKFYDDEFLRNGWKYVKEEKVFDWGKDYGGKIVYYSKSNNRASLQYAGNDTNYGWTYSISLSWGFD